VRDAEGKEFYLKKKEGKRKGKRTKRGGKK
jgi:hypothetical protein